jgi:glycosyltransferase involved in cell wall biosynthesis
MEPPIRVLVTAFAPVPGSSPHASAVLGMAQALRAELDLVTLKNELLSHREDIGLARMFRVPVGMGTPHEQREAFGRAVSRQVEGQTYDAVHVRGPIEGQVVAERKEALSFRFIYEIATFPDEAEGQAAEAAWQAAHEVCCERADLLIVPTDAAAKSLAAKGFGDKVERVSPGVDVNAFDWVHRSPDTTTRILYLGSFEADRDLGTLFSAIKRVVKDRPIEVLVAGDSHPDRRARLRTLVDSFELGRAVTVRGEPRPGAVSALIGGADICIATAGAVPRFDDLGDLPQPLLEFVACRRPVIAAGVPAASEILRHDKEALLYTPGDDGALAGAIESLLENETLRERLAEAAYDRVRYLYSDGARRRRTAEVYEKIFPGSQRSDAWTGGFESVPTGMIEIGSDLLRSADTGMTPIDTEVPSEPLESALTGEVIYHPRPAAEIIDTAPALEAPDPLDEIADTPTRIGARSEEKDTSDPG